VKERGDKTDALDHGSHVTGGGEVPKSGVSRSDERHVNNHTFAVRDRGDRQALTGARDSERCRAQTGAEASDMRTRSDAEKNRGDAPRNARESYETRFQADVQSGHTRFERQWKQATERARLEEATRLQSRGKATSRDVGGAMERDDPHLGAREVAESELEHRAPTDVRKETSDRRRAYVWTDRGVVEAQVGKVQRSEYADVWQAQKTHKYSQTEIDASLRSLPEVRDRLAKGTSSEEFRTMALSTEAAERQIGRSYLTYYETDPIKVDFAADGRSTVVNGRHRLARADRLGIDAVPMHVSEQTRRPEEVER